MGNKIICIGREFGSGGHEIALRLGQQLGIKVYEKNLVFLACRYGEVSDKILAADDERATNPYLFKTVHEGNYHVTRGLPTSEVLFSLQSHEIKRIAARESCVFVGRCADFVLRNEDISLLRVFISAPFEQRVQRKMELESLSYDKARRLVKKMDKQRKKYYESYAGQEWGNPGTYDLCFNTEEISMEEAVNAIIEQYNRL